MLKLCTNLLAICCGEKKNSPPLLACASFGSYETGWPVSCWTVTKFEMKSAKHMLHPQYMYQVSLITLIQKKKAEKVFYSTQRCGLVVNEVRWATWGLVNRLTWYLLVVVGIKLTRTPWLSKHKKYCFIYASPLLLFLYYSSISCWSYLIFSSCFFHFFFFHLAFFPFFFFFRMTMVSGPAFTHLD